MRWVAIMACAGALVGCSRTTGILPAGPDTYTLTERYSVYAGGGSEAERVAMTKANDFCTAKGRAFVPNMMHEAGIATEYGNTGYTVTFRCLTPDDPAVASYKLQAAPNVIIEQRNR